MNLNDTILAHIAGLKKKNIYRKRSSVLHHQTHFLQFSSNDYLSLSRDPHIQQAYCEGYQTFGSGSGGSLVICGYQAPHQALERDFAQTLAVDDCLVFSSGYAANLAIARLLNILHIHALIDKGLHASFYDGLSLEKTRFSRYLHNNMQDFAVKSADVPENSVVITEGIFSISGQKTPLNHLASAGHPLIVDEAHSFGIVGAQGKGAVFAANLSQETVPLRVIPLGKAFAGQGAIAAGKAHWIEALLQSARSLIYSTAPSPALIYGLHKTLDVLIQADDKRQQLQTLIHIFKRNIKESPLNWTDSETPIQQLILGCAAKAIALSDTLKKSGIICMPIRYPTVHPKASGLRIVLNAHHEEQDIQRLFTALHEALV